MKIAVVGGGSTYTPELVAGFSARLDVLDLDELVLHDIDAERLEVVGGLAMRMLDAVRTTTSLPDALDGADIVLVQLRVGGQQARLRDETIPGKYGLVGQETTGPGGFAKAMRTVPVVLDIAAAARKYARDDAWIVDFTNPVGIVTRALLDEGHRAMGLCNVAIGLQRRIAKHYDARPEQVELDHAGLNHLTWVRSVRVDGVERLPELYDLLSDAGVPPDLEGCHTLMVGGYVVDGLVPVDIVKKLLTERPAIAGITLAGMPTGAPGMPGEKTEPFTIYAFTKDGKAPTVYATE